MLLIRHLAKASANRAIHRGLGSIDFTGAVRSEALVGSARDPSRRALVHIKANVGPLGSAVGFTIDHDGFRWTGESSLTAAAIFAPEVTSDINGINEAAEFLKAALAHGGRPSKKIYEEASEAGISARTLRRAKELLGVKSRKSGMASPWEWALPEGGQP
jgi:hypothetical protein